MFCLFILFILSILSKEAGPFCVFAQEIFGHGFTLLNKIRCADLSFRHRVAVEYFSIKPAIRSLGDSHGHLKLFNRVNTDSLDSKKENQSVFICENLCPINLRSLLLCKIAFSVCSLKMLREAGLTMQKHRGRRGGQRFQKTSWLVF
jgi:hypothetical protein